MKRLETVSERLEPIKAPPKLIFFILLQGTSMTYHEKDLRWLRNFTEDDKKELASKLNEAVVKFDGSGTCRYYQRGTPGDLYPRINVPKHIVDRIRGAGKTCRDKIQASNVALLCSRGPPPANPPPPNPKPDPKDQGQSQSFWVCSHLCHCQPPPPMDPAFPIACQRSCVFSRHLIWEPNWKNRLRDGCRGKIICPNCGACATRTCSCGAEPACLNGHRAV